MRMNWLCFVVCFVVAPEGVWGQSPKDIDQALRRAKAYLYSIQHDGNWDLPQRGPEPKENARGEISQIDIMNSSQWGGLTALVAYSLLQAGESPQDARVASALAFLKTAEVNGTYALGVRALVWQSMPAAMRKETLELAKRDRDLLLKNMRTDERCRPFFRYLADDTGDTGSDHSASQFAVLGLWAAEQCGAEVPTAFWKETELAWLKDQDAGGGGWSYSNTFSQRMPVTPSMTAAGVATLFITNDYLHGAAAVECRGNLPHKAIDAGLAWLTAHADETFDMKNQFPFYTLYGIERIGLASGYKYLGAIDWYQKGAAALLASQEADGSWGAAPYDTCFAVLFLARGRTPVLMNKLEYGIDTHGDTPREGHWNQRPRDVANLTRWTGRQLERELRWQIVNLKGATADLHDAPILYLSGNQTLSFSAADEEKLRTFVRQGGLILGNADCSNPLFATSFKKLGSKLFPPYEFRALPVGHLIYEQNFLRKNWRNPPQVQGLSNGARELMVLLPAGDPARFWQTGAVAGHEAVYELMANLFLYCTERRDPRTRGDSWIVTKRPEVTATRTVKLARLQHDYNWDPEPGGWTRLAAILHNENQLDLAVEPVKLGEGKLAGYKLAHLTTTAKVKFTDAQRAELKAFVEGGGTLLVDAAGGDPLAAESLEAELTAVAGSKPTPLPLDDPLYARLGVSADQIVYRPYAMKRTLGQIKGPRLRGAAVKGRTAVLFSPEDLSVGLVGQSVDGIFGYTPASAVAIVKAVVMGAAGQP